MQNVVAGVGIAFSAGVFVSLNLLGAGGGRPESADVIQTANAILSSVWFLSACVGGTYLNIFGPAITMCFGICTYAMVSVYSLFVVDPSPVNLSSIRIMSYHLWHYPPFVPPRMLSSFRDSRLTLLLPLVCRRAVVL